MKKLLAIILALTLVLSMGAVAFAAPSPVSDSGSDSDSLPAEAPATVPVVPVVPAAPAAPAAAPVVSSTAVSTTVVANKDMTPEQKETVDAALTEVVADDAEPVADFIVETEEPATVTVEAIENQIIYIVYPDGTTVKVAVKDLNKTIDGHYELPVDGNCVVIIANAK